MDAQRLLQRALSAQSDPVEKINVGGNVQPYLPLHFLGVAAYRLGDCAGAESYWNGAANRRMIARLNLLRQPRAAGTRPNCKPAASATAAAEATTAANAAAEAAAKAALAETAAVPAKPPDALLQALQNYLGGRYLAATRVDPGTLADTRARGHAYLIRGAARFMLASTGLGDQGLARRAARGDARARPKRSMRACSPMQRRFRRAFALSTTRHRADPPQWRQ